MNYQQYNQFNTLAKQAFIEYYNKINGTPNLLTYLNRDRITIIEIGNNSVLFLVFFPLIDFFKVNCADDVIIKDNTNMYFALYIDDFANEELKEFL